MAWLAPGGPPWAAAPQSCPEASLPPSASPVPRGCCLARTLRPASQGCRLCPVTGHSSQGLTRLPLQPFVATVNFSTYSSACLWDDVIWRRRPFPEVSIVILGRKATCWEPGPCKFSGCRNVCPGTAQPHGLTLPSTGASRVHDTPRLSSDETLRENCLTKGRPGVERRQTCQKPMQLTRPVRQRVKKRQALGRERKPYSVVTLGLP